MLPVEGVGERRHEESQALTVDGPVVEQSIASVVTAYIGAGEDGLSAWRRPMRRRPPLFTPESVNRSLSRVEIRPRTLDIARSLGVPEGTVKVRLHRLRKRLRKVITEEIVRPINEINDPRLVKALAHPLRVSILSALEHRIASPSELADELDVPLPNLSYHIRMLCSSTC